MYGKIKGVVYGKKKKKRERKKQARAVVNELLSSSRGPLKVGKIELDKPSTNR